MLAHWNSSETTLFFKGNRMERIVEKELWQYLKQTDKPIVLYGMGNGADKIIKVLEEKEIRYNGVFASDGFVRDKEVERYTGLAQRIQNLHDFIHGGGIE